MNTLSNQVPSPNVYQVVLNSASVQTGTATDGYYQVNIPGVISDKQYYCEVSRFYAQELDSNLSIQVRMLRARSYSVNLQNTYETAKNSYTNIIGNFEIQHSGAAHYVAWCWNPVSEMLSGGFVNGSILNNGTFHIRLEYLDGTEASFTASAYDGWEMVLTFYEVYNHDSNAIFKKVLSEPSLKTQVQGATHSK